MVVPPAPFDVDSPSKRRTKLGTVNPSSSKGPPGERANAARIEPSRARLDAVRAGSARGRGRPGPDRDQACRRHADRGIGREFARVRAGGARVLDRRSARGAPPPGEPGRVVHARDRCVLERADLAPRRRFATPVVLEPDLGPPPRFDGHAPVAAAPGRQPPIAALAVGLAHLHDRDRARGRSAPIRRIDGQRPPERGGIARSRAAPREHHRLGRVVVRPGTEGGCRRTPPAPVDRAGRTHVHRVLCTRGGTRTPRDRAQQDGRRHREHARGHRVLGRADRHRDRDLEVPALRHRRRDPQGVGVRLARGVLHGGVRTRRRWCGGGDGLTVDPDAVVRGRGARGDRIPTGVGSRQTVRRQGRVREAFDPVRGTGGARRAAGRDVRGR